MTAQFEIHPGDSRPTGARVREGGVNFCMFSRAAERVWLRLYRLPGDTEPLLEIELDPAVNRTFFFWHVFVAGATPGLYYAWRTDGPNDTKNTGRRFDPHRDLLDPWARNVSMDTWDRQRAIEGGDSSGMRASIPEVDTYDWQGDRPLNRSLAGSVIYELHVGGFTRHPSSAAVAPGSYRGVIEKIPYLVDLGITDVELMPVMAFDPQDMAPGAAERGLENYWGYSPVAPFAPHPAYAVGEEARNEFRDMVKALHEAGIGVILDVVLNHTAEGGRDGPIINFKGFANEIFYHLDPADRSLYRDFTGCGNTINCNHPLVARYLVDCLEYWVREMHVDGFRLDLASVLARGEDGEPMYHAPVLWAMEFSPVLAGTHLIAEAWDAAGLYQVGDFPGFRWAEWNGDYRDTLRRFVRGDPGQVPRMASRIAGSSDLYAEAGGLPLNSINFVTCHDGFTLRDLVSYNERYNEANGEGNADGHAENLSWNCGTEGPSDDPEVEALRQRQARNYISILLTSQGIPMIRAGDEFLDTQSGNNNAYCQNNEISWLDWSRADGDAGMVRFVREMIGLRRRHPSLQRSRFLTGQPNGEHDVHGDIQWHGAELGRPGWHDDADRCLAFTLSPVATDETRLHVMMNMGFEPRAMAIPADDAWTIAVDTALPSPRDIAPPGQQHPVEGSTYKVGARTVVVLEAVPSDTR